MALIDVRCLTCGHVFEAVRLAKDWPATPPCEECQQPTEQTHLPKQVRWTPDPVVIYQAPDGSMRFPPDTTSTSTAMYDKKGFTRIELRGFADVRRFEKYMNAHERSIAERKVEQRQAQLEAVRKERHSEIRRGMEQGFQVPDEQGRMRTVRLGEFARDVMREAVNRTNQKRMRVHDPGFRVSAYSQNHSNRDD
jgi:hypothetical protein